MNSHPHLTTAFFPPIAYFFELYKNRKVTLCHGEIFPKQTFRNRCVILNANGLQNLTVPVEKDAGHLTLVRDIKISYAEDWRKIHLRSIESAYRRTPYYEYYFEDIENILNTDFVYLKDLNESIIRYLISKIGLSVELEISDVSEPNKTQMSLVDPKSKELFKTANYIQTFSDRFGFQNNLSVLDLLLNEGPNSISILMESNV